MPIRAFWHRVCISKHSGFTDPLRQVSNNPEKASRGVRITNKVWPKKDDFRLLFLMPRNVG